MKPLVSISDFGSIRILDIPLDSDYEYAKSTLQVYGLQEVNNNLCLENISIDNLPPLSIRFIRRSKESLINQIYIGNYRLNQKECDTVFNYFKERLGGRLNIVSEKEEGSCYTIVLSNLLHRVNMFKQKGLTNDENSFPFQIRIFGRLIETEFLSIKIDEQQKNDAIRKLYLSTERVMEKQNNRFTCTQIFLAIKVLILIFALIVAFLFALNGRYSHVGELLYFDKWTKEIKEYEVIE